MQDEVSIPGAFVKLNYLSTRAAGYLSLLRILLTPPSPLSPISPLGGLSKVHVRASVQGRLYQRWYPAGPGLVHRLVWNKTDVYGQEVWGLTHATGKYSIKYKSEFVSISIEREIIMNPGFPCTAIALVPIRSVLSPFFSTLIVELRQECLVKYLQTSESLKVHILAHMDIWLTKNGPYTGFK